MDEKEVLVSIGRNSYLILCKHFCKCFFTISNIFNYHQLSGAGK